jgi:bacteriocin biosynthesis cyclodehydratase domain-containing protein
MVLRLDPKHPPVWRTPHSIQFGVDSPAAVLDDVTNAQERMISALIAGVSRSGLDMIARSAGSQAEEATLLLDLLAPAFPAAPQQRADDAVTVIGAGAAAQAIAALLADAGATVAPDGRQTRLVVIVADYVIDPQLHGHWLRRDVPHLPVVFGDARVRIGPFVEPGDGPCLYCLELHRTDADPAWPAMASQLLGLNSPLEDSLLRNEVASRVARLVFARLRDGATPGARSVEVDGASGAITVRHWEPHTDCACTGIDTDEPVSPVHRESATPDARRHDPIRLPTRRGAVDVAPA